MHNETTYTSQQEENKLNVLNRNPSLSGSISMPAYPGIDSKRIGNMQGFEDKDNNSLKCNLPVFCILWGFSNDFQQN